MVTLIVIQTTMPLLTEMEVVFSGDWASGVRVSSAGVASFNVLCVCTALCCPVRVHEFHFATSKPRLAEPNIIMEHLVKLSVKTASIPKTG